MLVSNWSNYQYLLLFLMHLYEILIKSNKIQVRNRNLINFTQESKVHYLNLDLSLERNSENFDLGIFNFRIHLN